MAKTKVSEWSSTASSNTDIDSINIAEGCAPSGINDAIRELMSQVKDFQAGTYSDPFNGPVNGTVGATTPAAGAFTTLTASSTATLNTLASSGATLTGGSINNMAIGASTASSGAFTTLAASGAVTLSGGTANGVAYLNGSKVLTTGSALQFDGSNLGLGVTPSAWSRRAFQIAATAGDAAYLACSSGTMVVSNNVRYNSGDFYINSTNATYYAQQTNGSHVWATAPSGTAGNAISFTQAMTLDASGNLGVGTTSPSNRLDVASSTNSTIGITRTGSHNVTLNAVAGGAFTIGLDGSGGGTERARIDSSGNLLVGKTSNGDYVTGVEFQPAGAVLSYRSSDVAGIFGRTDNGETVRFTNNSNIVGSISTTGSATAYNTSSDYRLKHDIQPMTGALAKIAALKPCTYKWNIDNSESQGFIAHELQEVVPECVTGEKDAVDAEGNPVYQGIDSSFLVATLTAAIQELKAELDSVKSELNTLKGN
jgi:hypothetical protein